MGSGRKDLFYTDNLLHQRSHYLNSEVLSRLVETVYLFVGRGCWFLFTKVSVSLLNFRWHFCAPFPGELFRVSVPPPLESFAGPSFCCIYVWHWFSDFVFAVSFHCISLEWSLNLLPCPVFIVSQRSSFSLSAYPGSLKITLVKT